MKTFDIWKLLIKKRKLYDLQSFLGATCFASIKLILPNLRYKGVLNLCECMPHSKVLKVVSLFIILVSLSVWLCLCASFILLLNPKVTIFALFWWNLVYWRVLAPGRMLLKTLRIRSLFRPPPIYRLIFFCTYFVLRPRKDAIDLSENIQVKYIFNGRTFLNVFTQVREWKNRKFHNIIFNHMLFLLQLFCLIDWLIDFENRTLYMQKYLHYFI